MYGNSNSNLKHKVPVPPLIVSVFSIEEVQLGLGLCIGTWSIKFVVLLSVFFLAIKNMSFVFLKSSFEDYLHASLCDRRLSKLFPIQMLHQRYLRV